MRAQELLSNDLLQEAMTAIRRDLLVQIATANLEDVKGHQRLVMAMQIANAFEKHLRNLVHDGEQAVLALSVRGKRID